MKLIFRLLAVCTLIATAPAYAALKVFATVPEWGALANELGGDKVDVYVATSPLQDPHHVEAKPSLISHARNADLVIATGAELEIGWLPLVIQQAGNPRLTPGKPGYFEGAQQVTLLEVPKRLDRADGDVHAAGNPHIQLDPRNIARIANALAKRLAELDPANASTYQTRYQSFNERWNSAISKWEKEAQPLKGVAILVHHHAFTYLNNWLGLKEVAALEPKPGIEPTSAHLSDVLALTQQQPVKMVIRPAYQSSRASEWIASRSKINAVTLPFTVGGTENAKDLFGFFEDTVQRLLAGLK
ncbi:MAG: zinc ABC transporter substrate-binding protein [Pseudomonadota bacterium]